MPARGSRGGRTLRILSRRLPTVKETVDFDQKKKKMVFGVVLLLVLCVRDGLARRSCDECLATEGDAWPQRCRSYFSPSSQERRLQESWAAKMAQHSGGCEGGCEECREVPRMIYALGCSGSSATGRLLANVFLKATKVKTLFGGHKRNNREACDPDSPTYLNGDWEALRENKNCFYKGSPEGESLRDQALMASAMTQTNDAIVEKNAIWLFNPPPLNGVTLQRALDMGTRAVSMIRSNRLDRMICQVRDCFDRSLGSSVNASTGQDSDLCFERRHVANPDLTKVKFYPDQILRGLRDYEKELEDQSALLQNFSSIVTVTFEHLFAFEFDATTGLQESTTEWHKLLKALGYSLQERDISDLLKKTGLVGTMTRKNHKDLVFNYDELETIINQQNNTSLHNLLRPF